MIGHRARIGYCSPPFVTEIFIHEFYGLVPDGVTLLLTTLEVGNAYTQEAFDGSWQRSLAAARAMADAGADVIVLGGNPVNQSLGIENLPRITGELSAELGVPVVTSSQSQQEALHALGARRVATGHVAGSDHDARVRRQTNALGFECVGVLSAGSHGLLRYGAIPVSLALQLGRDLHAQFPEADALHFANAHWPTIGSIERLEEEIGRPVTSAAQAIIWKALRMAGVDDRVTGFGRLLAEH